MVEGGLGTKGTYQGNYVLEKQTFDIAFSHSPLIYFKYLNMLYKTIGLSRLLAIEQYVKNHLKKTNNPHLRHIKRLAENKSQNIQLIKTLSVVKSTYK